MTYVFGGNSVISENVYRQMFVCCALTVLYSTLGQSIASIYNLSGIYISYRPPCTVLYIYIYVYMTQFTTFSRSLWLKSPE